MTTPFDKQILWVHWKGSQLSHDSIAAFAQDIKQQTPNVTGIMLKSSDGHNWQGANDSQTEFTINGPDDIARWVEIFGQNGLDIHLWCVVRGDDIETEAGIIIQACNVAGVKSMALDVEGGQEYFGGKTAQHARSMITRIRKGIASDFHLALNMDARGSHPDRIHIQEWIPFVQSIHPMIYHWHFSDGKTDSPEIYIDIAFGRLAQYGLPIIPMLQTYSQPSRVPDVQVTTAGVYSLVKGAPGITYFRIGRGGLQKSHHAAVAKIDPDNLPANRWLRSDGKRIFQVTASTLNARDQIGGTVTVKLKRGDRVEIDPNSRTEQDEYVWWQHQHGWSAERKIDGSSILMIEVTPGILPFGLQVGELMQPITPQTVEVGEDDTDVAAVSGDDLVQKKIFRIEQNINAYNHPATDDQFKTAIAFQPGDHLIVDANDWHENDERVWWRHEVGWFTERTIDESQIFATDVNPEIARVDPPLPVAAKLLDTRPPTDVPADSEPPAPSVEVITPEQPTAAPVTPEGKKLYQVARKISLNIRSEPGASESEGELASGDIIEVDTTDPDHRREQGDYVWLKHSRGWSAQRRIDGNDLLMICADDLPGRDAIFSQLPLALDDTRWFYYFGNTVFAFRNGRDHNYDGYSQGLHGGLDFGHPGNAQVFAGVEGEYVSGNVKSFGPRTVTVRVGDYLMMYGHVGSVVPIKMGTAIKPDTLLCKVSPSRSHLHLEIRYFKERFLVNPLLLMPETLRNQLIEKFTPVIGKGEQFGFYPFERWQTPLDQPIITLAGKVLGPTA